MALIVPRSGWGSKYADGFGPAPVPASEVWLHHTVTPAPSVDEEAHTMQMLERIGQQRFGGGISYTWAVMPSGNIYQGHSVDRRGAHTKGRNTAGRAIVLVGNYEINPVTQETVTAIKDLLGFAAESGWIQEARLTGGHRQAPGANTVCPGRYGMEIVDIVNSGVTSVVLDSRPLRRGSRGMSVRIFQQFMNDVFPEFSRLVVDGEFGPKTEGVAREFQSRMCIEADGIVGPRTRARLRRYGYVD